MENGFHLTIDAFNCEQETLRDIHLMETMLRELPPAVGMRVIDGPFVKYHNAESSNICTVSEEGPTGVVILAESHSSAHAYPSREYLAFDLFSCKQFNPGKVIDYLSKYYHPRVVSVNYFERGMTVGYSERRRNPVSVEDAISKFNMELLEV